MLGGIIGDFQPFLVNLLCRKEDVWFLNFGSHRVKSLKAEESSAGNANAARSNAF